MNTNYYSLPFYLKRTVIKSFISDLGYKFNRAFVIKTGRHTLDNFKVGGWSKPELWIDGERLDRITDEKLLNEVIEDLREMIAKK